MRLIDADAVMKRFADIVAPSCHSDFAEVPTWNDAVAVVNDAPTVDAEPVVRCRDCKWWDFTDQGSTLTPFSGRCKRVYRLWADRDAFCSYGERREDEDA